WNFSAHFSSDPKSLRPEVCPLSERTGTGTPALRFSSWINENNLPFYNFFTSSFGRDAGQTALVRRRHDGDAGKRRDRSHSHHSLHFGSTLRPRCVFEIRNQSARQLLDGRTHAQHVDQALESAGRSGKHL